MGGGGTLSNDVRLNHVQGKLPCPLYLDHVVLRLLLAQVWDASETPSAVINRDAAPQDICLHSGSPGRTRQDIPAISEKSPILHQRDNFHATARRLRLIPGGRRWKSTPRHLSLPLDWRGVPRIDSRSSEDSCTGNPKQWEMGDAGSQEGANDDSCP